MNRLVKIGVACCRCGCIMGPDGKPASIGARRRPTLLAFGWFDSPKLADAAARAAGWRIEPGPLHYCPACRAIETARARFPALAPFVELADLLRRGGVRRI